MKTKLKILLAIALAVLMGVITPMQALAYSQAEDHLINTDAEKLEEELNNKTLGNYTGNTTLYISDLMIANGDTAAEAKKKLHDNGFLVYDCDLNEGTEHTKTGWTLVIGNPDRDVAKKYTYLGYKITTDRNKAITDINAMNQEGGYMVYNYLEEAKKYMPGANDMASGIKAACVKMKENLSNGSEAAKVAKEYLDLFCVPETSKDTTGPKLGDYLLDEKRTEKEYLNLILTVNTLILNIINSYLCLGITETTIKTQIADGGKGPAGTVISQYTSYNGATGYTELKSDDGWIINAAQKMRDDNHFADVNKTILSDFFADLLVDHGAQVTAFKRVMKEDNLSETAKKYLKDTIIEESGGPISDALGLGKTGLNAYELLTKGSDRMLALFYSYLPKCCDGNMFHDVLEVCASDYQHRLPQKFTFDIKYDIPWATTALSYIQAEKSSSASSTEIQAYNGDIDLFVTFMKTYADQYKEGMEEYRKNGNKISASAGEFDDGKGNGMINQGIENQAEADNIPYYYHVAIRDAFAPYKVSENQSLLDYLISTVDGSMSEDDARKAIYPVVKALGKAKMYSVKSCNMLGFLTNTLATANELAGAEMSLDRYRIDLEKGYGSKNFTVWVGSHKDLTDPGQYIAITNENVRDNLMETKNKEFFSNETSDMESLKASLVKCAIAVGSFIAGAIFLWAVGAVLWAVANATLASSAAIVSMGICAAAFAAAACSLLMTVAIIGIVFAIAVLFVFLVLYLVELLQPEPDPVYTTIPTMMIDNTKDKNGDLTNVAKYDVVRDENDKPADLKASTARGWIALYYTRDKNAGSPLTLGPDGSFFANSKGSSTPPDSKCAPLSKFLYKSPFDLNYNCFYDYIKGIYLFFYTEDSLAGKSSTALDGKYIASIKIGYAKSEVFIKDNRYSDAGILKVEEYLGSMTDHEVLNSTNFSPDGEYCTLIAFTTTNTASKAITDIRAAQGTQAEEIAYGSILYHTITSDNNLRKCPAITCDKKEKERVPTDFSYGLYTTKDSRAGDPILTSSLSIVTDLAELEEGYDVASYFAGVPLDFNSWDHEEKETFDSHCYLAFSSGNSTDSDTEYVAGFAFFAGSEDWLDSDDSEEYTMEKYAKRSFGAKLIPTNLTPSFYEGEDDSIYEDGADRTFLGYVTTKNPKRALTDIAVFTGEPKSTFLPGNVTVGNNCYCSCEVFTQGDYYFYGSGGGDHQRWIRPSHTYFSTTESEVYDLDYDQWGEDTAVMPRAMYGCGACDGGTPIKVSDILYSYSSKDAPVDNSKNSNANSHLYRLSTGKSLGSERDIGTGWQSVHSIDHYYYDDYDANGNLLSSFDLGLGIDNPTDDTTGTGHLYMYYKAGPVRRRGNYVSNIKISGYTGKNAENNTYNSAVCSALSGAEDIVNIDNPITLDSLAFTDFGKSKAAYYKTTTEAMKKKYDDGCFFVSVSYSDVQINTVRSARVVEQVWAEPVLESKMKLPLYGSTGVASYDQTSLAVFQGEEGDLTRTGKAAYGAYAMYKSTSGYNTNRVEVRFINIAPGTPRSDTLSNVGSGVAEYYVGLNDSTDPFLFKNYSTGLAACICLQSYNLDQNGQNKDKYIGDIAVAEAPSYDGSMELAAAKLGAMGYPYAVDFDISEGAVADGTNNVTVLGVRRVDDPQKAVKDIKISSDNLGKTFDASGIRYQRVGDKPVKLAGADKEGVYLYITYGASSDTVLWSDIVANGISLDKVDWFSLDYSDAYRDPNFDSTKSKYMAAHPGLSTSVDTYLAGIDATKKAQYNLKSNWEYNTALTNIGFIPSSDCPEQNLRHVRYEKEKKKLNKDNTDSSIIKEPDTPDVKDIYWAGCSAYKEDKFIVPVTKSTVKHSICTFNGTETSVGLRYTNTGNERFAPFGTEADDETGLSASVFSSRDIWMIAILSAVFLLGLAAIYIVYRKKHKNV